MLTTYRRALALPGAWQFSLTGFVARMPIAMIGLGIVLLISTRTGSYALAGLLSASFQVAAAVGAIASSRWMDRMGQHRLLPWLATANAVALVAFVAAVELEWSLALQVLFVVVAGAAQPAIGSMVRARWAAAAPDAERLRSAFAVESIIDELIFSVGPLITAFLAFQLALPLPLLVAAVIGLVGGLVLTMQRGSEPRPAAHQAETSDSADAPPQVRRSALRQPGLLLVVIGALGLGGVFGTYEVAVVAFTQDAGAAGLSGLVLGLWALGSMVGGIVFGAQHWKLPLARQVIVLTAVVAIVLVPAPFIRTIPVLAVATLISGAAIAPALIAVFSLTERLVPGRLLTEGLTWTNSGLALGFSAGTTTAGFVIDAHGTTPAFVLPVISALLACVSAVAGQRVLLRASEGRQQAAPAMSWNVDPVPGPAPGGIIDDPTPEIPTA